MKQLTKINYQNIQAAPTTQCQKNKQPNQKVEKRPKQTFLQRRREHSWVFFSSELCKGCFSYLSLLTANPGKGWGQKSGLSSPQILKCLPPPQYLLQFIYSSKICQKTHTHTWKDAQYRSLLERCKSKLQWDVTSHQSEWPSSNNLQRINAGAGVEKREPSYTAGGNVTWYSHCAGQCWDSLKI